MQVTIEIADESLRRLLDLAKDRQEMVDYILAVAVRRGLEVLESERVSPDEAIKGDEDENEH